MTKMPTTNTSGRTIVITGWGWKEYAVAAAVALRVLDGRADVMGMSKRRLPEFLEEHGGDRRAIYIVGVALGGDAERLSRTLSSLRATGLKVVWISSIPIEAPHKKFWEALSKYSRRKQSRGFLTERLSRRLANISRVYASSFSNA